MNDISQSPEADKGLILIVDDLPENVLILKKTLLREGYKTEIATNGMDAIKMVKDIKPDLILLDVLMPHTDGYEVCERIKNNPETERIPVIFLTALHDMNYIVDGFNSGGVDYISKPYSIPELLARVKTHVELKKLHDLNISYINKLFEKNRELNETKAKLIELNNSKDKFFSIIAHDLRNPFQGLIKAIDYIINDFDSLNNHEILEILKDLSSSSSNIFKLLENLLEWSRVQSGKIPLNKVNQNIHQLVENCIDILKEIARQKEIILINEIDTYLVGFFDVNMISTVLRNLISNSIKFSNKDSIIKVQSQQPDNKFIEISVSDNGVGIPEEKLYQIFSLGAKNTNLATSGEKGTGLGLILCKELVEKNGGTISVISKENLYTKFSFTVPISIKEN